MSPPEAEITELPSSPGARLRREREGRGMSQQQAAEALNLDPVILAYLEANEFASLGAPVFVKGHLRRYATLLGLNDDELLRDVRTLEAAPRRADAGAKVAPRDGPGARQAALAVGRGRRRAVPGGVGPDRLPLREWLAVGQ